MAINSLKDMKLRALQSYVVMYSPSRDGMFEQVRPGLTLSDYIRDAEKPVILIREVQQDEYYLKMQDVLLAVKSQAARDMAVSLAKDKEKAQMALSSLKGKASKLFNKLVAKVEYDVTKGSSRGYDDSDIESSKGESKASVKVSRNDSDDDDDDDSYGDVDDDDEDNDSDNVRRKPRAKPMAIFRSDSDSDDDTSYGPKVDAMITQLMEIISNALSRKDTYELLKRNDFNLEKALRNYLDGDEI